MACVRFVVPNMELVIVHYSRLLRLPDRKQSAGEGATLFGGVATPHLAVFRKIIPSMEPKIEPVQNAYGKKDSTCYQKAP